LVLLEV
jgi:hypothetical protein